SISSFKEQHIQPFNKLLLEIPSPKSWLSTSKEPNSFITIATFLPASFASIINLCSKIVFPLPKKPVSTVIFILSFIFLPLLMFLPPFCHYMIFQYKLQSLKRFKVNNIIISIDNRNHYLKYLQTKIIHYIID